MAGIFLGDRIPDEITRYARELGPDHDEILEEIAWDATRGAIPIIGPEVGGWLSQLARIRNAERVFEFGSGIGYSAYWFCRALPPSGEIVLTDLDPDNIDQARTYLDKGGMLDRATFEVGDAVEIGRASDGPFDIALIDIEKFQYSDAFDAVRDDLAPGGVVVADNTMTAGRDHVEDVVDFGALLRVLEISDLTLEDFPLGGEARRGTQGIVDYLGTVLDDPAFETTVLPLGDGVTVSTKRRE